MRSSAALGVALLAAISLMAKAQMPAPDPMFYDNIDYQFAVKLPAGFPACVSEHTNHGVQIVLDRKARCADPNNGIPFIDVFAAYNVAWEAKTPYQLARIVCRFDEPVRIVWLTHVRLGGRKAWGCRRYFQDGRVSVEIVTLRWTEPWAARWIEVGAYIETTADRYQNDMRTFRRVVKTVWIHPDGSDD